MVREDMEADSMRRAVILAAVLTLLITTPVCASAKNDGDAAGCGGLYEPFLVSYTCYIDQGIGSHGDPVQDGMIAGHPAWYGMTVVIYEAIPEEDGSFVIGPYIESGQILDTGYGRSIHDGIPSKIREDKASRGSIETGKQIDQWVSTLTEAKEKMDFTQGHVFIQLIEGAG